MLKLSGENESGAADVERGQRLVPWLPLLLALAALLLVRDLSVWASLTIAGLGMGMILFVASAGLTLVFGLMGVLNFGHGIFVTLGGYGGAFMIAVVFRWLSLAVGENSLWMNVLVMLYAAVCVFLVSLPLGWLFEKLLIRPAGPDPIRQILLTAAGAVVFSEICIALLGPGWYFRPLSGLQGSWIVGEVAIEKMRLLMIVVGLLVWWLLSFLLNRTLLGILVRAMVENRELVEAGGYRTRGLANVVFVLGCGLAAVGGLVWGSYQQFVGVRLGNFLLPYLLMILMIGGLGSITGTLIAALLVGLVSNYVGYLYSPVGAFSCILLTLAVLAWRPQGLYHRHVSRLGNAPILGADMLLSNALVDKGIAVVAILPFIYLIWLNLQRNPLPVESILSVLNLATIALTMILRHPPKRVTQNPLFWFLAFMVTYWPFFLLALYQDGERLLPESISLGLVFLGFGITLWARFSLGRNIGFVPAERQIVSSGPYRYIRHPIYSGLFFIVLGTTFAEFSLRNALLNLLWIGLFAYKSIVEENFLKLSEPYANYMKQVRWRWLPFLI